MPTQNVSDLLAALEPYRQLAHGHLFALQPVEPGGHLCHALNDRRHGRVRRPAVRRAGGSSRGIRGRSCPPPATARRITAEHRLVYKVVDDAIRIAQCRLHYT